jgi:Putative Na+/H+ antiporter
MQIEKLSTILFFCALLHCFSVSSFSKISEHFKKGSALEAFFHLLSEVEIVFGFWAFIFLVIWFLIEGSDVVIKHQQSLNMTEPLFIFCIMILSSTRPIVAVARSAVLNLSKGVTYLFYHRACGDDFSRIVVISHVRCKNFRKFFACNVGVVIC